MSISKRLKWLGPVRLEVVKKSAKALGRRFDVPHMKSLDLVAQACGWLSYRELTLQEDPRHGAGVAAPGSDEDVYELWCLQLAVSFGLKDRSELKSIECLPQLYRYLRARPPSVLHHSADEVQDSDIPPHHIHDPMLRAGDWRDAEFRHWLRGLGGRTGSQGRDSVDLPSKAELDELNRLQEEVE